MQLCVGQAGMMWCASPSQAFAMVNDSNDRAHDNVQVTNFEALEGERCSRMPCRRCTVHMQIKGVPSLSHADLQKPF